MDDFNKGTAVPFRRLLIKVLQFVTRKGKEIGERQEKRESSSQMKAELAPVLKRRIVEVQFLGTF